MTQKELEELGWHYDGLMNNREIYSLCNRTIFIHLHDDSIGLIDSKGEYHYCNLTKEHFEAYTALLLLLQKILDCPEKYTLKFFQETVALINVFEYTAMNGDAAEEDEIIE